MPLLKQVVATGIAPVWSTEAAALDVAAWMLLPLGEVQPSKGQIPAPAV